MNKYRVTDLNLAAALVTSNYPIVATQCDSTNKVYFLFENSVELQQTINAYWADRLPVKARLYADNTHMLKKRTDFGLNS